MNIVQIGANKGYDDLTDYILKNKNLVSFLLLVEPLEVFNESLNRCYNSIKNKVIENLVVVDSYDIESTKIYLDIKMDDSKAQTSLLKEHVYKHFLNDDSIIEKEVNCIHINSLFKKHNLEKIDYLFIDAEGFDDRIIKGIDFNLFSVGKIYYETVHIDRDKINSFLESMGYEITNYLENSLAIKK